jgi:hypothetical protein
MTAPDQHASVRSRADDVQAATGLHTSHRGFAPYTSAAPAFASVVRGPLRLLLPALASSGAPATPTDPGRNRIHLVADGRDAKITRLRDASWAFGGDVIAGPDRRQILLAEPAGNLIGLFRPASSAEAS